jgi:hypothetical protein
MKIGTVRLITAILMTMICSACTERLKQDNPVHQLNQEENDTSQSPIKFEVDPFWPKRLPNNWILGEVAEIRTK